MWFYSFTINTNELLYVFIDHHGTGMRHEKSRKHWFDVSEVPAGETIFNAEFRIYQASVESPHGQQIFTIDLHKIKNVDNQGYFFLNLILFNKLCTPLDNEIIKNNENTQLNLWFIAKYTIFLYVFVSTDRLILSHFSTHKMCSLERDCMFYIDYTWLFTCALKQTSFSHSKMIVTLFCDISL